MTKEEATAFFAEWVGGEHHLPRSGLKPAGWGWSVQWRGNLATHDGDELTRLVLLAHARAVRVEIQQGGPGAVRIVVWQRDPAAVALAKGHPTIAAAVERFESRRSKSGPERVAGDGGGK